MDENQKRSNVVNHPNLHFFPNWLIDLSLEVHKHHKELLIKHQLEGDDFTVVLAKLAAEVNIAVDGMFDEKGMEGLAREILARLQARRTIQVIEPSPLILPP